VRPRSGAALLAVRALGARNGLNLRRFVGEFFANRIGGFFGMDVLVSAVVLCVFASAEGRRMGMRSRWMPVVSVLPVGVSPGLPLFYYLREIQLDRRSVDRP
jgi:hypothetical protein